MKKKKKKKCNMIAGNTESHIEENSRLNEKKLTKTFIKVAGVNMKNVVSASLLYVARYKHATVKTQCSFILHKKCLFLNHLLPSHSLFHMNITAKDTKSSHQDRGPCYLYLPIFFLYIHFLQL